MTKKQKGREERYRDEYKRTLEFLNTFPLRYATLMDASEKKNPILFGYPGYEDAVYEQRFV